MTKWVIRLFASLCICLAIEWVGFFSVLALGEREQDAITYEATDALKRVVELWKDEHYDKLYDHGTNQFKSEISKEDFIGLMRNSQRGLQCCWATIQDVVGQFQDPTHVLVKAKIGYTLIQRDIFGDTLSSFDLGFKEETFIIYLESGQWKVDIHQILDRSWIRGRGGPIMSPLNGICPITHPVKALLTLPLTIPSNCLFFLPGDPSYNNIRPTLCFATASDARAAGCRGKLS